MVKRHTGTGPIPKRPRNLERDVTQYEVMTWSGPSSGEVGMAGERVRQ